MSKTLISVEEIKEKNVLRFTYDDNSYADFEIKKKNNERIIKKAGKECVLIDNPFFAFEKIKTGDFKHCIFLCHIMFEGQNFNEIANFSYTIFTKNAIFQKAIFTKKAIFQKAIFTKNAIFQKAIFAKNTDFQKATFAKNTDFENAVFTKNTDFGNAVFAQKANFLSATFTQNTSFFGVTFTQNADFYDATFTQDADFGNTKIQGILNFTKVKKIKIDLHLAIVDRIEYSNTEFSADNRETFLTLKNVALKQNDQIRALEFHQQEYQTHFDSLNWKQSDKWILGFEYWASNFGASAVVAVSRFIGVIMLFYILINGFDGNIKVIIDFILPISYDIGNIFKGCVIQWWDRVLFLFYKILQLIMIYEIIKSFRKFSRQL